MSDDDHINRINALIQNARNTWFAMLAVLVFVGVTLLSVEHIDFYGVGRATELPLVGVSVPTPQFFYVAPILTVAIYGYFHLYLIRLWDELSVAEARIDGQKLGAAIAPWLIADSALFLRRWLREDHCTEPRALELPSVFWNIVLAWAAGPIVLGYLWYKSLPARDPLMSGISSTMIVFSVVFFIGSAWTLVLRMRREPTNRTPELWKVGIWTCYLWIIVAIIIGDQTYERTHPDGGNLADLNLIGEEIMEQPNGWVPGTLAMIAHRSDYCSSFHDQCGGSEVLPEYQPDFWQSYLAHRSFVLGARKNHNLSDLDENETVSSMFELFPFGFGKASERETQYLRSTLMAQARLAPDLRSSRLDGTFLVGANLVAARLTQANLYEANLENAVLSLSKMEDTFVSSAYLVGARLRWAQFADSTFSQVDAQSANFAYSDLRNVRFQITDLSHAIFTDANLDGLEVSGANLNWAILNDASLVGASFQNGFSWNTETDKSENMITSLEFARLRGTDLTNTLFWGSSLRGAQVSTATANGIRLVDADVSYAYVNAVELGPHEEYDAALEDTHEVRASLSNVKAHGTGLRDVDLSDLDVDDQTELRNVFLDQSVIIPDALAAKMGDLCQRVDRQLNSDKEYFAHWRGWIEAGPEPDVWHTIAWDEFRDVTPIPPPTGCAWKTGPMPDDWPP